MSFEKLKALTTARVALEKAGGSLSTDQMLEFKEDHALARDAVWSELDMASMVNQLKRNGRQVVALRSLAKDRTHFIRRPDLGRRLDPESVNALKNLQRAPADISVLIADGLSAQAIENHSLPFLEVFFPMISSYTVSPLVVLGGGRVALSDEVGQLLQSRLVILLIGERPGLSSPDSMGIYLTYDPRVGNTDERRNCISNIRNGGISYEFAASKLSYLISESMRRKLSGVALKDNFDTNQLTDG